MDKPLAVQYPAVSRGSIINYQSGLRNHLMSDFLTLNDTVDGVVHPGTEIISKPKHILKALQTPNTVDFA
ncbi:hypothetical protein [Arcanobacterium phocae]|uniref:hypothetical protein n=1 Tax=Arcanobacterium phocae TaxID=131112 RepID=UPI001C0EF527|nr:hypothetical protein [Arcanobacterium phocae]